ncbi:MAG: hypothetical protein LUI60_08060 [Clostridia bacterium]|nr:hypothetical protein [Clostridia bacterium]
MGGKFLKTIVKVLIFAVYVLLILGIIGAIVYFIGSSESGMYVMYGTQKLVSGNGGITIEWNDENNTATFQIGNSDDWGVYTVEDCTAKIVPNVNDDANFEYTIAGISGTQKYSSETDLTAAFVEDYTSYGGNGFKINEDGEFTLCIDSAYSDSVLGSDYCIQYMLYKVYGGKEITLSSAVGISTYPYFAVKVISPDSKNSITIPFILSEVETADTEQSGGEDDTSSSSSGSSQATKYAIYYDTLSDGSFVYSLVVDCADSAAVGDTVIVKTSITGSGMIGNVFVCDSEGDDVSVTSYGSGVYSFVMPASAVDIVFYIAEAANNSVISYYLNPNKTTEIDLSELGVTASDISVSFKTSGGSFYTCTALGDWTTGYTQCWNFTKTYFDSTVMDYMIKSATVKDGILTITTNSLSSYSTSSTTDSEGYTTSYNKFVIGNLCYAKYTADQITFETATEYNKEFNQSSYYICDITDNSTGNVIKSFCFRIYLTSGGDYDDGLFDIW